MVAQLAMPYPLKRMFGHLKLDIERSFKLMPEKMEDAIQSCLMCKFFHTCDYDSESRYFLCPNRDLFDQLEDLQCDDRGSV